MLHENIGLGTDLQERTALTKNNHLKFKPYIIAMNKNGKCNHGFCRGPLESGMMQPLILNRGL
jgi:hypothetical protein